jgi:hypothetical protein
MKKDAEEAFQISYVISSTIFVLSGLIIVAIALLMPGWTEAQRETWLTDRGLHLGRFLILACIGLWIVIGAILWLMDGPKTSGISTAPVLALPATDQGPSIQQGRQRHEGNRFYVIVAGIMLFLCLVACGLSFLVTYGVNP